MAAVTRTWLGGGNNSASNPNDWGPAGAPQLGDTLVVSTAAVPGLVHPSPANSIMNVSGNALAGDLVITGGGVGAGAENLTANLSHQATMTAAQYEGHGTFNMSQNSTLNLTARGGVHVGPASATVNMSGNENAILADTSAAITVNLAAGAHWRGNFQAQALYFYGGAITVNGAAGSSFDNQNFSRITNGTSAVINTDVVGTGRFYVINSGNTYGAPNALAKMEFAHSVGAGQQIVDTGLVVIDHPNQFHGVAHLLTGGSPGSPLPAEIDLMGLATADSYSYKNDMLSIYHGNSVIDRLNFVDNSDKGFVVEKVGGNVHIVGILDPTHPPAGLPLHG